MGTNTAVIATERPDDKIIDLYSVTNLAAKDVRLTLKYGHGFQFLCEKFRCTPTQLENNIKRLFKRDTPKIIKELQANDNVHNQKTSEKASATPLMPPPGDNHVSTTAEAIISPHTPVTEATPSVLEIINNLNTKKLDLKTQISNLESQHTSLSAQHRSKLSNLRELRFALKQLKLEFEAKTAEALHVAKEANDLAFELNQLIETRETALDELQTTDDTINNLEITIFVYADHNIEVLNANLNDLNDSGSEELYQSLIKQETFQDLRVRDIRLLARIARIMHNAPIKVNVAFDDTELEAYLNTMLT